MPAIENPALTKFIATIGEELVLAQVWIRRSRNDFALRHVEDHAETSLRSVKFDEARAIAQSTAAGEFRPLKSAPTLIHGWQIIARNESELGTAVNQLYPGAIADWFAALAPNPPVTNYRDYVNRQTGMYRITAMLADADAAQLIQTVCARENCLKRRFWTVPGLAPDAPADKSLIPCLEPCAVLMESARKAVRANQQEKLANEGKAG
jgi:hypothetical protein